MKRQLNRVVFALVALVLSSAIFYSCKKNTSDYTSPGAKFSNTEMTTATFMGQVLKEDGSPLDGATVTTGTHMMTSDADGFFYFSNISTPSHATLIKVEKVGYFKAFRTIKVIANQDNQTKIMVMELPVAENLSASAGGTITISSGGSIEFPANAIVDEATNQPYTGNVRVYAKWIDPSSAELPLLLPGDLRAINADEEERVLTTYGMQAVELVGNAGQPLQLGNEQMANVTFPIPSSMMGNAPSSIPLWHFDENQGMWVEDGEALLSGSEYRGAVSHFSFWNCDVPANFVTFSITLVDASSNPVSGAIVRLKQTNAPFGIGYGVTNSNGITTGAIPANGSFDVEYVASGCSFTSPFNFIQTTSSTTTNLTLGPITVSNSASPVVITGTVEDCSNSPLANAPVKITVGNYVATTMSSSTGAFTSTINCLAGTSPAVISAFDPSTSVNGSLNVSLVPNTPINVGVVPACGTQSDFITFSVTNPPATTPTTYTMIEPSATFSQYFTSETGISGFEQNSPSNFINVGFGFDGPQTVAGVHNLTRYYDSNDSTSTFTPAIVSLTSYGVIGAKISGSFSTTATGFVYNNAAINCNFRVTRQQ